MGPQSAGSERDRFATDGWWNAARSQRRQRRARLSTELTGGSFKLDVDAAKHALDAHVGRPLELTTIEAAHAVHRLVNAHMAERCGS